MTRYLLEVAGIGHGEFVHRRTMGVIWQCNEAYKFRYVFHHRNPWDVKHTDVLLAGYIRGARIGLAGTEAVCSWMLSIQKQRAAQSAKYCLDVPIAALRERHFVTLCNVYVLRSKTFRIKPFASAKENE